MSRFEMLRAEAREFAAIMRMIEVMEQHPRGIGHLTLLDSTLELLSSAEIGATLK